MRVRLKDQRGRFLGGITDNRPKTRPSTFGSEQAEICPFFDSGCSIYPDRGSACRTYHCKTARGLDGQLFWRSVGEYYSWLDDELARQCLEAVEPAGAVVDWPAFYGRCWAFVQSGDWQIRLDEQLGGVEVARQIRDQPLPEKVVSGVAFLKAGQKGAWIGTDNVDVLWVEGPLSKVVSELPRGKFSWQDHFAPDQAQLLYRRGLLR